MVTIYALINPFNNEPFYVGSTKVKINQRLSAHKRGNEGTAEKRELIKRINESGQKIIILPLIVCSEKAAVLCEYETYKLLKKNGYNLFQDGQRIQRHIIKYLHSVIPDYK